MGFVWPIVPEMNVFYYFLFYSGTSLLRSPHDWAKVTLMER